MVDARLALTLAVIILAIMLLPVSTTTSESLATGLSGYIVCVDPGHGGSDPGAVGLIVEKDVNLAVALKLTQLLEADGATVILTRSGDYYVSLYDRVQTANQAGCDIFVSIHSNAASVSSARGVEVYHYPGSTWGQDLAVKVYNNVVAETGLPGRFVSSAYFYVLRYTSMPAILVEMGFVTNPEDANYLSSQEGQWSIALGILYGIQEYFGVEKHNPLQPRVTNVRVGDHGTYVRFVVDLTKQASYTTYYWASPPYLAVYIYNAQLDLGDGWTPIGNGWYRKSTGIQDIPYILAKQLGTDVIVVITTPDYMPYNHFVLTNPDRIVIDIYR